MPDEHSDPHNNNQAEVQEVSGTDLSFTLPRLSFKAGLTVYLSGGLFLFLLSRFNPQLVHALVELASVVLLVTVFLIGWNTRHLVRSQFFVILAVGFLAVGLVDLLHMLASKDMQILPGVSTDMAIQLWLIARTLGVFAFLCAIFNLGRRVVCTAKSWLLGFLLTGSVLLLMVWPLGLFPTCQATGNGFTSFKVIYEYVLIGLLVLSASILLVKSRHLNRFLNMLLLLSIGVAAISELMFTFHVDDYGFFSFAGYYFKLGSVVLVYFALVEGTLRSPFSTLFQDMTESYEELNLELQKRVAAEKQQEIAHREASILYRMSRVMHSTLNLDELAHLILSAATSAEAGGFERATLFTANRRTGMLQGMLGVSQEMATLILPPGEDDLAWENLHLDEGSRETQRTAPYNQIVVKQRLPLESEDNALAKAFLERKVVLASNPDDQPGGGKELAQALGLGPYACAPLVGRDQIMGVLLVDNPVSRREINLNRKRFLELFASQAGSALDIAGMVKRLEMAHSNLQEVQEQLIHGEKMAVLGEMAAQVAHELRNPLVSIGGFAQRLNRQDLKDAKANEYAGIIAREVRRMEEMLGNILSFSKKQMVSFENCDVIRALQEVIDLEYEHFQKQHVEIVSEINDSLPEIVGDYRQLRQVFLNLFINARQVMHDGGVIKVRAKSGSLRGDKAVVIEIEDTGGGISPEVMRNIFNPFFSTTAKGTGLGLSISHRIIAHHHGGIEVVNAEQGARFIVTLPVEQPGSSKEGRGRGR